MQPTRETLLCTATSNGYRFKRAYRFIKGVWDQHPYLHLHSLERWELCSNSELRRWFSKGNVTINNRRVSADELVYFPIAQLSFKCRGGVITLL